MLNCSWFPACQVRVTMQGCNSFSFFFFFISSASSGCSGPCQDRNFISRADPTSQIASPGGCGARLDPNSCQRECKERRPDWMPDRMSECVCQKACQKDCQIECENICQIECRKNAGKMPDRMSEYTCIHMPYILPDDMSSTMSEWGALDLK